MTDSDINPLIRDKVNQVVDDRQTHEFIYDILEIERSYAGFSGRGKLAEYEAALAKYVRRD